jgi:nucleotide-binding universal stress UspA family protein
MFRTVIWATDGSDAADTALPMVEELAGAADRLIVVHHDEILAGRAGGLPVAANEDELIVKIQDQTARLREHGLAAELKIVKGVSSRSAHVIADVAIAEHADLIIVGTRGLGPVTGLVLGSVTQRLLHLAPCPVLAVPPARTDASAAAGDRSHAAAVS